MCNLWLNKEEVENTLKGRRTQMDNKDILQVVGELSELLDTSQRVQEEATTKVDELNTIKDGLEESNSKLEEAVSALDDIVDTISEVEDLLGDAEEFNIT